MGFIKAVIVGSTKTLWTVMINANWFADNICCNYGTWAQHVIDVCVPHLLCQAVTHGRWRGHVDCPLEDKPSLSGAKRFSDCCNGHNMTINQEPFDCRALCSLNTWGENGFRVSISYCSRATTEGPAEASLIDWLTTYVLNILPSVLQLPAHVYNQNRWRNSLSSNWTETVKCIFKVRENILHAAQKI